MWEKIASHGDVPIGNTYLPDTKLDRITQSHSAMEYGIGRAAAMFGPPKRLRFNGQRESRKICIHPAR